MWRYLFRFLILPALLLPGATSQAQNASKPIAIIGVNVIPMDRERVLRAQSVIVERGIITRMGPARSIRPPAGATVIDGKDKFLIPGLADMHVHLAGPVELQRALLELFVANGVTSVLNMRGTPEHLALRRDVASSRAIGPTIYTVGPYVNEPFFRTADEVEKAVREQKRVGYDFIKMHGDLSRDAYARLNRVAREVGIRVVGHAPRTLGIEALFEERQYALAHAEEFIYDRTHSSRDYLDVVPRIPGLTRSMVRTGTWLMPNLTAFKIIGLQVQDLAPILARPEMRFLPSAYRTGWGPQTNPYTNRFGKEHGPGIMARFAMLQQLVQAFHSGGVRLLVGTDALNTGVVPGFSAHDELAELVAAGLTPYQALRAGTANAAEFLGVRNSGTVAAGRQADLVLLDGNPLTDIANTRRIAGVMLRGRWFSRAEIAAMLEKLAAM